WPGPRSSVFSARVRSRLVWLLAGDSGNHLKKRGQKTGPRHANDGARFCVASTLSPENQSPKNNHKRMITGIGTPSSHNRISRPIVSSTIPKDNEEPTASFQMETSLPVAGVRHRRPRLGRRFRFALLQQFDRMQIRRADKGHVAVARRTVDGDAHLHQLCAGRVDVVDLIGEVTEIAV